MSKYKQARTDFEYLESLAEVDDMVEIDAEMMNLMQNPTKAHAAEIYEACIGFWFGEHDGSYLNDKRVTRIARRWGF